VYVIGLSPNATFRLVTEPKNKASSQSDLPPASTPEEIKERIRMMKAGT
jgi:hypothetical protein